MPRMYRDFNDWLAHQDTEALECRDLGHLWPGWMDKRTHYWRSARTGAIDIEMPCLRDCGVIRTRHIGSDGSLSASGGNSYSHPDGYLYRTEDKTAGRHVTRDHKAAIRTALVANVPAARIEVVDD